MESSKTGRPSIYGLFDPDTNELRYVGKANNVLTRLSGHISNCRYRHTPVNCWIRKLQDTGKRPRIEVLEVCLHDTWQQKERDWIQHYASDRLLNIAEGGNQPYCSIETRRENARKATAIRPKHVMQAYRNMESNIRLSIRYFPHKTKSLQEKLNTFRSHVSRHSRLGTLTDLDMALQLYHALKRGARNG